MNTLFIILAGWFVIILIGLIIGYIFNKMIIEEKVLNIFNVVLGIILSTITVYFLITMKNLM